MNGQHAVKSTPPTGAAHPPPRRAWESPFWHLEATARGMNDRVPRQFLAVADLAIILAAFYGAHLLAPFLQSLIAPGGALRVPGLEFLRPPAEADLGDFRTFGETLWVLAVCAPVTLLAMQVLGGYQDVLKQSTSRMLLCSVAAPVVGFSTLAAVLFALKYHRLSRLFIFALVLMCITAFVGYRSGIRAYRRNRERAGWYAHNVVVVASPQARAWLEDYFDRHLPATAYRIAGWLLRPEDQRPAAADQAGARWDQMERTGIPILGRVDGLGDLLIHRPVHDVVAVQGDGASRWLQAVVEQCEYFRVALHIVPEVLLHAPSAALAPMYRTGPLGLPSVVLRPAAFDADALFTKRVIDVVVSALLLVLLAPVYLLIAIAIKLTTPTLPVLYPWHVIGYKGKPFTGYKFTTMVAAADELKPDLEHLNEMSGPVFKIKDDPRVTKLGRFLRKYSLNELPQIWSVLKGDMSLVGPRPAGPDELARYELWHKRKLSVQPGVTCLWQVRGRNAISDFDDWVRMDLEYIDHWSLWLDLKILARTLWVVLAGSGS